jgi:hypothetical protein
MTSRTRVVVCGSSLYMVSLAAGLEADPQVEVVRAHFPPEQLCESLRQLAPAAVALDLADTPVDLPVALLREHPGTLLLGMDPTSDSLLVLSGHHTHALTVADLVAIIIRRAAAEAASRPEPTNEG